MCTHQEGPLELEKELKKTSGKRLQSVAVHNQDQQMQKKRFFPMESIWRQFKRRR
jgi:hypothetical protein